MDRATFFLARNGVDNYAKKYRVTAYCVHPKYLENQDPGSGCDLAVFQIEEDDPAFRENHTCMRVGFPDAEKMKEIESSSFYSSGLFFVDSALAKSARSDVSPTARRILIAGYPGEKRCVPYGMVGTMHRLVKKDHGPLLTYADV